MAAAFRVAFATINSGSGTTTPVFTVPAGVIASDYIVVAVHFIAVATLSTTFSTSGSGTMTEDTGTDIAVGTSGRLVIYRGTGFVAGDTITITPGTANRNVGVGAAYSGATYEQSGTPGTTSTTVATSPTVTTSANNDVAVAVATGASSTTGRTFSSHTASWTQRTFIQGGSSTRFPILEICDLTLATAGATGDLTSTASGTLLSSVGEQVILTASGVSGTVRKVNVGGTATTVTGRKINVGGVATAATRRINVGGVAV